MRTKRMTLQQLHLRIIPPRRKEFPKQKQMRLIFRPPQSHEDGNRKLSQGSRPHPRKRSMGSIKRRSYKLNKRDVDSDGVARSDSMRSRRKVSAVSEVSDPHDVSGDESPGVLSTEDLTEFNHGMILLPCPSPCSSDKFFHYESGLNKTVVHIL